MNMNDLATLFISIGSFVIIIGMLSLCTELAVLSSIFGITGFVIFCLGITIGEG
jgi:hypothetical protein